MAFNNSRNNRNKVNTNTRIVQLYNENAGEDSSTMQLGLWNNYASININPILPKAERVDGKVYNYEKTASCLLSLENIIHLYQGIKLFEKEEKLEKEGKRKIYSIATKTSNVIVKIGSPGEYDGIDSNYLVLISLNNDGEPDGNCFYIFNKNSDSKLLLNYNEEDGSCKSRKINTDWESFKYFVEYCMNNMINGGAHGANKNIDYQFNKFGTMIETIKALIENIISGNNGSSKNNSEKNNNSGFSSSRRRRSSIKLDDDINNNDEDLDGGVEFEMDEEDEEDEVVTKTTNKKKSKSSSSKSDKKKKSSKKVSVDEMIADMENDLDDLEDIE